MLGHCLYMRKPCRFKRLPLLLREQVRSLHSDFVAAGVTLADALSVDSSLMHAQVKAESLSIFNAHLLATFGIRNNVTRVNCPSAATLTKRLTGVKAVAERGSTATVFTA